MPPADDLPDWLRLQQSTGVGPETGRRLLSAFGEPHRIFSASLTALLEVVPARIAHGLLEPIADATRDLIGRTMAWASQPGNHVLTLGDPAYPANLLEISDPPLILYAKGRLELLGRAAIAIVGSRNATEQGAVNAERFAEALARAGYCIVSGLALGIDAAAHRGGLRAAGQHAGSTIAVIGTGCDIVYPARNRDLAHLIADAGCILSEYTLGTPANAANFPRRNRLISGLARGVLVVEAAARSGSLITANMALEQGREVFAIPGSIHAPLSKGCHQLIRQGAKLVESALDVLEELSPGGLLPAASAALQQATQVQRERPAREHPQASASPTGADGETCNSSTTATPLGAVATLVLDAMGHDPVAHDKLASRAGIDAATLSSHILMLELDGLIETLPGGLVRRLHQNF